MEGCLNNEVISTKECTKIGLPLNNGEFRLSLGVLRSSLNVGDEKSWFGLPAVWNEWQSSDVGVTEPGRKKESKPSTKSCDTESMVSGGLTTGLVGALVFALLGRPKTKSFHLNLPNYARNDYELTFVKKNTFD